MSLDFIGASDLASVAGYTHGTTRYTLAAWFNADTTGEGAVGNVMLHGPATMGGARFAFGMNSTNNALRLWNGWSTNWGIWSTPVGSVVLGRWYHAVCTYDGAAAGNNPLAYLDGVPVAVTLASTPSGTFPADGSTFAVGSEPAFGISFDGRIAEAAVWNRILTAAEAASVYRLGVLAQAAGLGLYWPLGDTGLVQAQDVSGNGRHGTVAGTVRAENPPTRPAMRFG